MLKHYMEEISMLEFSERDMGIQKAVTSVKGEMNARNILHSSITLEALAEFFVAEFGVRCDFIKIFVVSNSCLCQEADAMTTVKTLFQAKSFEQRDKLISSYSDAAKPIIDSLLRSDFPRQIEEGLIAAIENRIKKNNMYVEIAYQTIAASKSAPNPIAILKPTFHGIGIDVAELWKRHIKSN